MARRARAIGSQKLSRLVGVGEQVLKGAQRQLMREAEGAVQPVMAEVVPPGSEEQSQEEETDEAMMRRVAKDMRHLLGRCTGRYSKRLGRVLLQVLKQWIKSCSPPGTNVGGMERNAVVVAETFDTNTFCLMNSNKLAPTDAFAINCHHSATKQHTLLLSGILG